jgi:hypothetical protein
MAPFDPSATLIALLGPVPGVVVTKKLASTNFTAKKKVFAFTKGNGVVLKLPPPTVSRLLAGQQAALLVMGKRTMKEWVVIHYRASAECGKHLPLFIEVMTYATAAKAKKA